MAEVENPRTGEFYRSKGCVIKADAQINDIDESHRKVDVYVSGFGNKDAHGDIILPTAYNRTLSQKFNPDPENTRIKHLEMHNWEWRLGMPEEFIVDKQRGLRVISKISNSTRGRDIIEDYKLNLLEHSVGIRLIKGYMESEPTKADPTGTYIMEELELMEYSSVTWGANEQTPLNEIKSLVKSDPLSALEKANTRMNKLGNALRKGDYTDEKFETIDIELKQIQQLYNDIVQELSSGQKADETLREDQLSEKIDSLLLSTYL